MINIASWICLANFIWEKFWNATRNECKVAFGFKEFKWIDCEYVLWNYNVKLQLVA